MIGIVAMTHEEEPFTCIMCMQLQNNITEEVNMIFSGYKTALVNIIVLSRKITRNI